MTKNLTIMRDRQAAKECIAYLKSLAEDDGLGKHCIASQHIAQIAQWAINEAQYMEKQFELPLNVL